jgi:hypothetical protein
MKRLFLSISPFVIAIFLVVALMWALQLKAEAATSMFSDDFESGAGQWTEVDGDWSVVAENGNHYYHQSENSGNAYKRSVAGESTWTDYSIQARVRVAPGDSYGKLIARYQDIGHYYFMAVRADDGRIQIKKMVSPGSSATLGSGPRIGITSGEWYTATLVVEGNELRGYINGVLMYTATDDDYAWGKVGLGTHYAAADFDDVTVISLVPTHTLTVDAIGSGSGSVTSKPEGIIDCGITCTATLERGTVVTLTAVPTGTSTFAGWMGACTGEGDCVVTMDEAKSVTAVFSSPGEPMLIVHKDGTGTGTVTSEPPGVNCGITCTFGFSGSPVVTLTAKADTFSEFTGWDGAGCSGSSYTCTLTMDAAKTVTATFTHVAYPLTVIKAGSGTGTVTSEPEGIDCGDTCTAGMSGVVTLTATPAPLSSFTGWAGEECSTGTCVVTMDAARTITATFETYTLYLPMISSHIEPVDIDPLYVATDGDDSNPGTMAEPFETLDKAVSVVVAGQTIYMRGGTYSHTQTITLSQSGNSVNMYRIWAYTGEQPVLDFSGVPCPGTPPSCSFSRGFLITGDRWHLKGLEIRNAPDNGVKIEGNYNVVEQCILHHNQDTGLQIGFGSTPSNADGSQAAYNQIINCDSYRNFDPATNGGNADGFACKLHAGKGNRFTGCRAWENSDDGWDLYQTYFPVTIENSWTWHNGDPAQFGGVSGNGNGFKLGGNYYDAAHILTGCIAFDNEYKSGKGFDQNHNTGGISVTNSVAWGNRVNFSLKEAPAEGNHVLKNNVSFDPVDDDTDLAAGTIEANNSWNLITVTASITDFLSLDENLAKAPRQSDGSLPDNDFARLAANSDLIDAGVDVGLPHCGSAPDLGAFEYCPSPDLFNVPFLPPYGVQGTP